MTKAYDVKERLHSIYEVSRDSAEALDRLAEWSRLVPYELAGEFGALAGTVIRWRHEIAAYFDTALTNARTEYLNGVIRLTKNLSPGLAFETLRDKMVFRGVQGNGGYRWEEGRPSTKLAHGMSYATTGGGAVATGSGTDLVRLFGEMYHRVGDWADPRLWRGQE